MLETISEQKRYCPRCKSDQVVKGGKHTCQKGVVQRYQCKLCGTSFSNDGYYRGKRQLALLQYVGVLYQQGLSDEKIMVRLKEELGITVSKTSIAAWVKRLGIQPRKSSGNQKNKTFRDLVELGVVTVVRYADSFHPERFVVLDNFADTIGGSES